MCNGVERELCDSRIDRTIYTRRERGLILSRPESCGTQQKTSSFRVLVNSLFRRHRRDMTRREEKWEIVGCERF